jgi:hypothetical protein
MQTLHTLVELHLPRDRNISTRLAQNVRASSNFARVFPSRKLLRDSPIVRRIATERLRHHGVFSL